MDILSLSAQKYDIGKCAVFYTDPSWDGTTNLFASGGPLIHLGTTEGEVVIAPNPAYSELTLPEATGPSALKRYITGTRPTFSLGLFPDLDQMAIVSPTGIASLGFERQRLAKTLTLWIVPEALFLKADANGFQQTVSVVLTAGNWLKDGIALTTEEERLLNISSLCWKCDVAPESVTYRHEDGGKSLSQVEVTVQHDFDKPEGAQQVLVLGEYFGEYPIFDTDDVDFEPV
jgi:hypothetical protein